MKKIVIAAIALSTLALSGCDNLLDKQPMDQFTDGNFWTSKDNVEAFANRFYDSFSGYSGAFYFPTLTENPGTTRPFRLPSPFGTVTIRHCVEPTS